MASWWPAIENPPPTDRDRTVAKNLRQRQLRCRELSMSKTTARPGKPRTCANCGGNNLRRRTTTYPVRLAKPSRLAGREILVRGVALYECQSCGHQLPTPAGQAKLDRSIPQRIRSCERPGCYKVFISASRTPRQKFCSEECRRAMERVLKRERQWREPREG